MSKTARRGGARSALRRFLGNEALGGLILIGAAALALIAANSDAADFYHRLLHAELGPMSIHAWINDGLMVFAASTESGVSVPGPSD